MTAPAPLLARTTTAYAPRPPYLTVTEYRQAATGVDSNNLVPNGSAADQLAALEATLRRASAWVDSICHQTLAATRDTEAGRYRLGRDGQLRVPLRYFPVAAVAAVAVGESAATAAALTDLTGCELDERGGVLTVPAYGWAGRRFVSVDYVSGFAHTTLTAAAAAGAQTLTVAAGLGVTPGQQLTLPDAGQTETVTVAAGWSPTVVDGPVSLPLAAPLADAHTAGVAASAMPYAITEAAILLASAVIKTRGAEDFEMPELGQQPGKAGTSAAYGLTEVEEALDLLAPLRRAR